MVSRSSTEADYRSIALAIVETFWIHLLLEDLHVPLLSTPVLWCDNLGTLALASNPIFHARNKHIEIGYHFIRDKIQNNDIVAKHISTTK